MNDSQIITLIICIAAVAWAISTYNSLIKKRNQLKEAWSGIDVALKQRANLIPNLINAVKGYSAFEAETMEKTTSQRIESDEAAARGNEESQLSRSLNNLLAVAENYPDLKANNSFLDLQNKLSDIELQINNSRQRYNSSVTRFNTQVESFPSNIMARIFGFRSVDYFEIDLATQRQLPDVEF